MTGIVTKYISGKGYGFIQSDNVDGDIYFKIYDIKQPHTYLMSGDVVEFDLIHNDINQMRCKEAFRAQNVVLLKGIRTKPFIKE